MRTVLSRFIAWFRRSSRPTPHVPVASELVVGPAEFRRLVLRERARSDRNGGALALVLVDGGADAQLSRSIESWSTSIARRVRCTDAVGWFDAKTLGVVLPDTDHEGALVVIRQLRSSLPSEATQANWRIFVHPEHTTNLPKDRPASGSSDDPLDLLRAPARSIRVVEPRVASVGRSGRELPLDSDGGGVATAVRRTTRKSARRWTSQLQSVTQITSSWTRTLTGTLSGKRQTTLSSATAVEVEPEVAPLQSLLVVPVPPLKRAVDIVGASLALIAFSPVMLGAMLAVRLSSPGPVLFRQRRAGLGGRPFDFYKFRTMYIDAEQRKKDLLSQNEQSGPVFKMAADPRITRVGRFLRKASIDELPQLWNVLKGDMSLVGPRPPIVAEVAEYDRWQRRRLDIQGGLTCIWQVSGRSAIQFDDWVRLDLRYVETASLATDLGILVRTVPAVLTGRGAH